MRRQTRPRRFAEEVEVVIAAAAAAATAAGSTAGGPGQNGTMLAAIAAATAAASAGGVCRKMETCRTVQQRGLLVVAAVDNLARPGAWLAYSIETLGEAGSGNGELGLWFWVGGRETWPGVRGGGGRGVECGV
jgi:hypothetical protein